MYSVDDNEEEVLEDQRLQQNSRGVIPRTLSSGYASQRRASGITSLRRRGTGGFPTVVPEDGEEELVSPTTTRQAVESAGEEDVGVEEIIEPEEPEVELVEEDVDDGEQTLKVQNRPSQSFEVRM